VQRIQSNADPRRHCSGRALSQVFTKVLIANRGAIACRIIRTLRRMGIGSVAAYSEADAGSLHVKQADEAVCIGPAPAQASYMNGPALIAAARERGAEAIHPGYGFLSESPEFAAQCADGGLAFVGPTADNMRAFALKHVAREHARAAGVPLLPGSEILADIAAAREAAQLIGFPVMLKATAGGGGIGMRVCENASSLEEAFPLVARLGSNHFHNAAVFVERFIPEARHVEVQVFGDGTGRVVAIGERDCSLQRRNQKIIEETPAPGLSPTTRRMMAQSAVRLASSVAYRSAGTVEFLFDPVRDEFYFLEVNTRLQVEHGITEQVTGIDLVEWMLRCAQGEHSHLDEWLGSTDRTRANAGCSIQARVYAEDPLQENRPSSGTITDCAFPGDIRVDTWIAPGTEISGHYDPMLAKLIVTAPNRSAAVAALERALADSYVAGIESNLQWLRQIVGSRMFQEGRISTRALANVPYRSNTVRVTSGGVATTVQDYPGRLGYWRVGVPPSGPMDSLAFRLGNRLLGNDESAAGLEITAVGPTLRFDHAATVCLAGAACAALIDGETLPLYRPVRIAAGQTLKLGRVSGPGLRTYLLFQGGLDIPLYLRSRSTFTLGQFGGHGGRSLIAGDVLHLNSPPETTEPASPLPPDLQPPLTHEWRLRVLAGPHGAPDFFTPEDIGTILGAAWRVHYNSNRTGIRLIGPKPDWARRDGGEAGLHPSNIHDNPYAVGALDFTGDMPILLGPDGPSLGGFVCPFVVIGADLWKLGQLVPGDTVCFECVDEETATRAREDQDALIGKLQHPRAILPQGISRSPSPGLQSAAILETLEAQGSRPRTLYRRQGDRHVLIEYGPIVLDLTLRLRVHALMLELQKLDLPGVTDITPGIRSLQVQYDPRIVSLTALLRVLMDAEERLGALEDFEIPSRIVWLPLSFNDPAVAATIARYMESVRADAPWCPDNIEFIRRINGLASSEDVRRIVFDARYLVMGLGDVYLGAPVAVPLDPRHRLVTTKYNPARTWTPPNVVGIGGAYMCIYGMEGPGGYQLFGRTIQVWNSYLQSPEFRDSQPWLLRFFDQIRFFPVTPLELDEWRRDFPHGRRTLRIETELFRLRDHRRFLDENRASIEAFRARRQAAFESEREAWARAGPLAGENALPDSPSTLEPIEAPQGAELVEAPLGGNVWKVHVRAGDSIEKGSVIAAIEAMKTECEVPSPETGIVRAVYIQERQQIAPGMPIIALEPTAGTPGGAV
jgi:urea carboxylase